MTTNFALSLSFEGIELFHRAHGGWQCIGRVEIGSATFDADLATLRQTAMTLAPDGFTSKLIIPADQIRFTAIDTAQTTQDDIDAKLNGATPYALDELVVDCERSGGRTHIAAVARQTLGEAEAFAVAHGFNPVAFVAVPEPFGFQKEVFFGPTRIMPDILGADASVTREDRPVSIAGAALEPPAAAAGMPAPDIAHVIADPPALLPVPEPEPAQQTAMADPVPSRLAGYFDAIPPEYRILTVAAPAPAPALTSQPHVDRVIPEVHPPAPQVAKPALVASTDTGSAQAPKLGAAMQAAARRPAPAPQTTRRRLPALAAGIAVVALSGALAWSQFAPSDTKDAGDAPIVIAQPSVAVPPIPEAGPRIPAFAVTAFGTSDTQSAAVPALAPAQWPATVTAAPATLAASAPDATPDAVQPPPAPPAAADPPAPDPAPRIDAPAAPRGIVPSPAEAERFYAATGVWQRSPRLLDMPSGAIPMGFKPPAQSAAPLRIAQPDVPAPAPLQDFNFAAPVNPPPAGATFLRDEDGFVQATPEGTVTPSGAIVIAGLPELNITPRPELSQDQLDRMALLAAPAPQGVNVIAGRPDVVPALRPADAQLPRTEQPAEAAPSDTPLTPGSVGIAALELQNSGAIALDSATVEERAETDLRPQLRPNGLAAGTDPGTPDITDILAGIAAESATLRFDSSTELAVATSQRPAARPSRFNTIVAAAQPPVPAAPAAPAAPVAAAAPAAPQNTDPIPGGVARAATQEDVIRLRDMNLIGVYGRDNARRALVRLSNGRYVRVEVGSALDGGQVTAIGNDALNYVKRGRTYAIELPGD